MQPNHEYIDEIDISWQKTGHLVVLFTHMVAQHVGLTATEFECYAIIRENGPLMISELAQRCRMTTGGMTKLVDRLETQGFAKRITHPNDRRRVIIKDDVSPEKVREIIELYKPLSIATETLLAPMTKDELLVIQKYLQSLNEALSRQLLHEE
jgi:MarR family transcriptional regulator, organic hydroperoxide resistance regulator